MLCNSNIFLTKYQKLGLRLNTLRLYGADKLAVRELLKVTSGLYQAMQTALNPSTCNVEEIENQMYSTSLSGKVSFDY